VVIETPRLAFSGKHHELLMPLTAAPFNAQAFQMRRDGNDAGFKFGGDQMAEASNRNMGRDGGAPDTWLHGDVRDGRDRPHGKYSAQP
jgi:hypothetical protein